MKTVQLIFTGAILFLDYLLLHKYGFTGGRSIVNTLLEAGIFLFSFILVFKVSMRKAELHS